MKLEREQSQEEDQTQEQFDPRIVQVALMALDECRTSLMMSFRYLDRALFKMPFEPADIEATLTTNGRTLFYNPKEVLLRYRNNPNELARDLLHTILHCVLRHPFKTEREDVRAWCDACDIAVEAIAIEMCAGRFACSGDDRRQAVAQKLREHLEELVPSKMYRKLIGFVSPGTLVKPSPDGSAPSAPAAMHKADEVDVLLGNARLFSRDSHQAWDLRMKKSSDDEDDSENEQPEHDDEQDDFDQLPEEGDNPLPNPDDESESPSEDEDNMDEEDWDDIAKSIEADLKTTSQEQSTTAGELVTLLTLANRRRIDYSDFLRQFATISEDLRANPEEFDYIFYTYGLEHYGNMPLVEPLEYYEHRRLREFVIALDTSGSCSGELVRMFVTRTYDILRESEVFGDKVNIRVLQCDARVQNDTTITNRADFEDFAAHLEVKGGGGTDFRPVFDYVGKLIRTGEFENLCGLIYFTDGMGVYPETPPSYDTAFVFVEENGYPRHVPPWAMKVIINQDQIFTN